MKRTAGPAPWPRPLYLRTWQSWQSSFTCAASLSLQGEAEQEQWQTAVTYTPASHDPLLTLSLRRVPYPQAIQSRPVSREGVRGGTMLRTEGPAHRESGEPRWCCESWPPLGPLGEGCGWQVRHHSTRLPWLHGCHGCCTHALTLTPCRPDGPSSPCGPSTPFDPGAPGSPLGPLSPAPPYSARVGHMRYSPGLTWGVVPGILLLLPSRPCPCLLLLPGQEREATPPHVPSTASQPHPLVCQQLSHSSTRSHQLTRRPFSPASPLTPFSPGCPCEGPRQHISYSSLSATPTECHAH